MKYLLIAPALIFCALFVLWPLGELARISLYHTNFITSRFMGLSHYRDIFTDGKTLTALLNSLAYAAIVTVGNVAISLLPALTLARMGKRWQDAARIVFWLPVLSAGIIIAQVWRWIFLPNGPINWMLGTSVNWFGSGLTAIPAVAFIVIVSAGAANIIILLSAISSVDTDAIEAAKIDGANWRQIKWRIIVPEIYPAIGIVAIVSVIAAFQIFETIYVLVPQEYAATMTYHIYLEGFQFAHFGRAAADAVFLLVLMVSMMAVRQRIGKA